MDNGQRKSDPCRILKAYSPSQQRWKQGFELPTQHQQFFFFQHPHTALLIHKRWHFQPCSLWFFRNRILAATSLTTLPIPNETPAAKLLFKLVFVVVVYLHHYGRGRIPGSAEGSICGIVDPPKAASTGLLPSIDCSSQYDWYNRSQLVIVNGSIVPLLARVRLLALRSICSSTIDQRIH